VTGDFGPFVSFPFTSLPSFLPSSTVSHPSGGVCSVTLGTLLDYLGMTELVGFETPSRKGFHAVVATLCVFPWEAGMIRSREPPSISNAFE
jgi:hypothetical protein